MKRRSQNAMLLTSQLVRMTFVLAVSGFAQSTFAQGTTIIPPPPAQSGAVADLGDPTLAYNPTTGKNYYWDCNKNAWIDAKTGETAPGRFHGKIASDGSIIPPPPAQSGAVADLGDPTLAYNPTTGQNFFWDRDQQTWKDSKTGRPAPGRFHGKLLEKACPPPSTATTPQIGLGTPVIDLNSLQLSIDRADNETVGTPKPSEEIQKVEEKKQPSWWESLIPSIGIGIGGDRERRDRKSPGNPCSPK